MRIFDAVCCAAATALMLGGAQARAAEEPFDACEVFTQPDAEKALGTAAAPEPVNPKARRPKVVSTCTYEGFRDGKAVAASVQFRFAHSEAEAQQAFDEARLELQSKPLLIFGAQAFWSARMGQLYLRKGREWIVVSSGSPRPAERGIDEARKLAEILAVKL
jgi:hypothetical protein